MEPQGAFTHIASHCDSERSILRYMYAHIFKYPLSVIITETNIILICQGVFRGCRRKLHASVRVDLIRLEVHAGGTTHGKITN